MTTLEKAKRLLRDAESNIFRDMLCDLGFGEDVLYEMACDILSDLGEEELENFIKVYSNLEN